MLRLKRSPSECPGDLELVPPPLGGGTEGEGFRPSVDKEFPVRLASLRSAFPSLSAAVPALCLLAGAPASAYFLSLEQKGQLLADGALFTR